MSLVELETPAPGVRLLRLADPGRRNALSPALQADLCAALDTVAAEIAAAAAAPVTAATTAAATTATTRDPAISGSATSGQVTHDLATSGSATREPAAPGSVTRDLASFGSATGDLATSGSATRDPASSGSATRDLATSGSATPDPASPGPTAPDLATPADRPRVLIITGAGTAFCAGADLAATFGPPGPSVAALRGRLRATYDSFLRVRRLPIPTIAAVQGAAVGAGVNLALACDVRIAGPRARFGVTFSRLGLHPGGGCTHFLVRTLGPQRALAILLDGATLDADEAHRAGLVLKIAEDPLAEALETATRWAALDPGLVADMKRAVTMAADGDFDDVLEFESWAQASSAANPAVAAALGSRR